MRYSRTIGIVGLAAAVAVPALAFNPQPEPPAFGMLGLVRTQTAVLNVVLTQPPDPVEPACVADISLVDALGQVFVDAAGNQVTKRVALRDNVADSLSVKASDILPGGVNRIPIRAVVDHAPVLSLPARRSSPASRTGSRSALSPHSRIRRREREGQQKRGRVLA